MQSVVLFVLSSFQNSSLRKARGFCLVISAFNASFELSNVILRWRLRWQQNPGTTCFWFSHDKPHQKISGLHYIWTIPPTSLVGRNELNKQGWHFSWSIRLKFLKTRNLFWETTSHSYFPTSRLDHGDPASSDIVRKRGLMQWYWNSSWTINIYN